ncbi:MAG: hypothetical protein ACT4P7_16925, partial [Gemmatimonadaceae bacterium]
MHFVRRLSPVTHALTALITVWCLGCTAFEPVIEAFGGDRAGVGMVCASEISAAAGCVATRDGGSVPATVSVSNDEGGRGFACGCQGCFAPAAVAGALAAVPPLLPAVLP